MKTNEEILLGVKAGNSSAFEMLYNQYSIKLNNFILSISNYDNYLAEEIVQITFMKIWEIREKIEMDKSFGSYLTTIAKNLLINHYNKKKLETAYFLKAQKQSPGIYSTDEEINLHFAQERVNTILRMIPPARQKIFIMSRQFGLTNKEIAKKLTLSENTIESQLSKSFIFMRKYRNVI